MKNNYIVSHLKDMNRKKIFDIFLRNKEVYKNEIARMTGISVPTVIKSIDFLLEKNIICEAGEGVSSVGRKPSLLKLNPNRFYAIGIIYEGDFMSVGLTNLLGDVLTSIEVKCNRNFEQAIHLNIEKVLQICKVDKADVLGIGIGIPGTYNQKTRELFAPLIGMEKGTNFGEVIDRLAQKYKMPVLVDNDVNLKTLGEFNALRLTSNDDLIHISVGTGIGAGIILNGKIRRGNHYMAGEIGYMTAFTTCSESKENGWLEGKVKLETIEKIYGIGADLDVSKHQNMHAAIEDISEYLAACINNITVSYDIQNVTLGGVLFELFGDLLFEKTLAKMNQICVIDIDLQKQVCPIPGVVGSSIYVIQKSIASILSD